MRGPAPGSATPAGRGGTGPARAGPRTRGGPPPPPRPAPAPPPRPPQTRAPPGAAGSPGPRAIPAIAWLLSLLALKLTRTRRVAHVDDLLADPAAALFAGLAVLPKKSALTSYSYRLSHAHQQRFLAALDRQMIGAGLATSGEAVFDLDFHAIMHWAATRRWKSTTSRALAARPVSADLLRAGHRHS